MSQSRLRSAVGSADRRPLLALVAITVAGLTIRVFDLGERVFHWDEGRVAYWTLRYAETGELTYAPIIHGPFLRLVNASVFGLLPPTDGTARLVVALVGGLLPLSAWLFRTRLDRWEIVALAGFLAFNPLLIYYSRFMRNDVLVGGFALVALGFAIRALDTRRPLYAYPSAVFLALSLSTKANTILYMLCFAGAAVLVVDHRLVRRVHAGETVGAVLRSWQVSVEEAIQDASGDRSSRVVIPAHLFGAMATFLAIVVFAFAPRPMLYTAIGTPSMWPGVVHEATVGSGRELIDLWITGEMQENPYLEYLGHELRTLLYGAAVVCTFAVVGFVVDGYARSSAAGADVTDPSGMPAVPAGRNRAFVAFACYWALASVIGYPAATDINAPWSAVHIVIPLAIPAAVGVVYVVRRGRLAIRSSERETAVLAAVILLVAGAGMIGPTATYWNSTDPDHTAMVQWAQPHNDLRDSIDDAAAVISASDADVDVLFVGADVPNREGAFYVANESAADRKGAPGGWYDRLPLPWYFERAGATVDSIPPDADREEALADPPPVVIVPAENRSSVDPHLNGYVARDHELRLWNFPIVVYVDESKLDAGQPDTSG